MNKIDNMEQHLIQQLTAALSPSYLQVINESANHAGANTQSHFKLVVVSGYFVDLKLIERHRFINKLFAEELKFIHALAIHTYTPDEWSKKNAAPDSPKCTGGEKS